MCVRARVYAIMSLISYAQIQTLTTTHECIDTVNTIVAILSFSNKATSIGDASTLSCIVRLVVLGKRCRLTYI